MAGIIFSQSAGLNDAKLGKLETPLRAVIMAESDEETKKVGAADFLFNVEKSNKYAETYQYQDELGMFKDTLEGGSGTLDSIQETRAKTIKPSQFTNYFTITKMMIDDATIKTAGKRIAEEFTRSYYKTRNTICELALANGTATSYRAGQASHTVDLVCADGLSLFNKAHLYGKEGAHAFGTQSNYFGHNRYSSGDVALTASDVSDYISEAVNKIRNMKNENGEPMGYTADTIVIPANTPYLERLVKQALGSDKEPYNANNAINIQCGLWNLVVLPAWQATIASSKAAQTFEMIVMSSEANKNIVGNVFLDRYPLDMMNWQDGLTRNWLWSGYCRFGVGFPTYKHMVRVKSYSASTDDNNVTEL